MAGLRDFGVELDDRMPGWRAEYQHWRQGAVRGAKGEFKERNGLQSGVARVHSRGAGSLEALRALLPCGAESAPTHLTQDHKVPKGGFKSPWFTMPWLSMAMFQDQHLTTPTVVVQFLLFECQDKTKVQVTLYSDGDVIITIGRRIKLSQVRSVLIEGELITLPDFPGLQIMLPEAPESADVARQIETMFFKASGLRTLQESSSAQDEETEVASCPLADESHKFTNLQTITSITAASVGATMFALPYCCKKAGLIAGPILFVVITGVVMEMARLLNTTMDKIEEYEGEQVMHYTDIVHVCFGVVGRKFSWVTSNCALVGFIASCLILMSRSLEMVFPSIVAKYWLLLLIPVNMGVAQIRSLSTLAAIGNLNLFFVVTGATCVLWVAGETYQLRQTFPKEYQLMHSDGGLNLAYAKVSELGLICCTSFYTYAILVSLPVIKRSMQMPKEFEKVICISFSLGMLLNMCFALSIYVAFGNQVSDNFSEQVYNYFWIGPADESREGLMKFQDSAVYFRQRFIEVAQEAAAATGDASKRVGNVWENMYSNQSPRLSGFILCGFAALQMAFSYPIYIFILTSSVEAAAAWFQDAPKRQFALRAFFGAAITVITIVVPYFFEVMQLVASVFCITNNVYVPLACYYRMQWKHRLLRHGSRTAAHVACLLLAICSTFFGFTIAWSRLLTKLRTSS